MSMRANELEKRLVTSAGTSFGLRQDPEEGEGRVLPIRPVIPAASPEDGRMRSRQAGHMELDRIVPDPDQPRREFPPEKIEELAASIKQHGMLEPISIRWKEQVGKWVVLYGERRYRAASQLGLKTIPCIFVEDDLGEAEARVKQLVENLQREDLTAMEQAIAFRSLMDMNGWSSREVAAAVQINESRVSRALAILELPPQIREKVESGDIPGSVAYELTKLGDETTQREVAERVVTEKLTRDDTVELVKEKRTKPVRLRGKRTRTTFQGKNGITVLVSAERQISRDETISALEDAARQARGQSTKDRKVSAVRDAKQGRGRRERREKSPR